MATPDFVALPPPLGMRRPHAPTSVLHVAQPIDGGVPEYVCELAAEQHARGWTVVVATPRDSRALARLQALGVAVDAWAATRAPSVDLADEVVRLRRLLARRAPTLVHLHSSKAGLVGRLAIRGRIPTVFQPHAWSFEAGRGVVRAGAEAWERAAARWADITLCVSEAERARGADARIRARWRVIPNGVDVDRFRPLTATQRDEIRRELRLEGGPVAACVGRLAHQKGQDVLLEAWHIVRRRVPRASLVVVGTGPYERRLRAAATPDVHFLGHRDDVPQLLGAADVVAAPSRFDGMSLAVLEAMACGRSVVATDVAGASEALAAEAGAIVPVEDPEALANAIVARLVDPARAAVEGRRGRARAERSHDVRTTAAAVAELYSEVLEGRARVPAPVPLPVPG
jgi:glycosyltransferase involved in cell wall biosynthesis